MKRFLILLWVAGASTASPAYAANGFFWFHTRPKSVLLTEEPGKTAPNREQAGQPRSRMMSVFSARWVTGASRAKAAPAKGSRNQATPGTGR